ncbi:MAG: hypothetical protein HYV16_10455 [Gammaproteobacteria bacterium]|nr:hypothetical protein [Gammaproteobacteria bacterium]
MGLRVLLVAVLSLSLSACVVVPHHHRHGYRHHSPAVLVHPAPRLIVVPHCVWRHGHRHC